MVDILVGYNIREIIKNIGWTVRYKEGAVLQELFSAIVTSHIQCFCDNST